MCIRPSLFRGACSQALQLCGSGQQSLSRFISTHVVLSATKSILNDIVADKTGSPGWLEQKLVEEQQTASKGAGRFTASQVGRAAQRAQGASGGGNAGFTKIERSRRLAERHGSSSSTTTKDLPGDAGNGADLTLTAKDLAAKAKWQQSDAAKSRLQGRLRDVSLEVWQRRKIELKLKHGSEKWEPTKKIAASSMEKIRLLNSEFPDVWTMQRLSEQFKVSQETVRRILKSRFRPSEERLERREQRRNSDMQAYKDKAKLRDSSTRNGGSSGAASS
ncbi:Required for respiratory growth protein 9 mitochondrial [Coemansia sp. RSA 1694]|nr:Required for respiratory growth protein 9 mitochondrial [Coemansia sp. RSA 1694]